MNFYNQLRNIHVLHHSNIALLNCLKRINHKVYKQLFNILVTVYYVHIKCFIYKYIY